MLHKSFSLSGDPFQGTDPAAPACLTGTVRALRADAVAAIPNGAGLLAVTGPAGSGKTTLLDGIAQDLASRLPGAAIVRVSCRTHITAAALVREICNQVQIAAPAQAEASDPERPQPRGCSIVLVIDDAHRLGGAELRQFLHGLDPERLSELGLRVVLAGEAQLRRHLVAALPRGLRRRIVSLRRLGSMTEAETGRFIAHRLERCGGRPGIFGADAVACVAQRSMGIPGRVDELCAAALYAAFLGGQTRIDATHVERAAMLHASKPRAAAWTGKAEAGARAGLRPGFGLGIAAQSTETSIGDPDADVAGGPDAGPSNVRRGWPTSRTARRSVLPSLGRRGYAALAASIAAAFVVGVGLMLVDRPGDSVVDPAQAYDNSSERPDQPALQAAITTVPDLVDSSAVTGGEQASAFDGDLAANLASGRDILEPVFPEPAAGSWLPGDVAASSPSATVEPVQLAVPIKPLVLRLASARPIPPRKPSTPDQAAAAAPAPTDCWWENSGVPASTKACLDALLQLAADEVAAGDELSAALAPATATRGEADYGRQRPAD